MKCIECGEYVNEDRIYCNNCKEAIINDIKFMQQDYD